MDESELKLRNVPASVRKAPLECPVLEFAPDCLAVRFRRTRRTHTTPIMVRTTKFMMAAETATTVVRLVPLDPATAEDSIPVLAAANPPAK